MRTNFAYRKDQHHNAVVQAFEQLGWQVCETWRAPDCPDFFAAKNGRVLAIEVKSKGRKLTPGQEKFRLRWKGEHYVVRDVGGVALVDTMQFTRGPL